MMAGRIAPRWTTERGMALNHTQRRAKDSLVRGWRMAHEQKEDIFSGALGNFTTIFHTHLYFPFHFRLFFSTGKFYSTAMFLTISHIPSSRTRRTGYLPASSTVRSHRRHDHHFYAAFSSSPHILSANRDGCHRCDITPIFLLAFNTRCLASFAQNRTE